MNEILNNNIYLNSDIVYSSNLDNNIIINNNNISDNDIVIKDIISNISNDIGDNIITNISNYISDNIIANNGIIDNGNNIPNKNILNKPTDDSFTNNLQNLLSKKIGTILNTSNISLPEDFKNNFDKYFNKSFDKYKNIQDEQLKIQSISSPTLSPRENISDISYEKKISKKNELIDIISKSRKKINDNLFLISAKYDDIYNKYNKISISIMIISTVSTFIEAIRLTMVQYIKDNAILINTDTFTLIMNIYLLMAGTIVTILSTLVRFKNYREIMEKLKNMQTIYNKYKLNYEKQERDMVLYFDSINEIDNIKYQNFKNILDEYNKEIKDINFFEDIRTNEIIKLNKVKALYDIQLKDITKNKELKSLELDKKFELKEIKIINNNELDALKIFTNKIINMKKLEDNKNKILNTSNIII